MHRELPLPGLLPRRELPPPGLLPTCREEASIRATLEAKSGEMEEPDESHTFSWLCLRRWTP
jgi:hypothetical protein